MSSTKKLFELFTVFFKMGLFTFGGGLAMLPLIQQTVVTDKGWMSEEEMVDCVAVAQSMPGVIAINAATYVGARRNGFLGALAATIGVIMPSFIIIILAVLFLGAVGENRYINGAFTGIKAASCALILYSAYKLGKQVLKGKFEWIIALAAFALIIFLDVTALWAIVGGAILGVIYQSYRLRKKEPPKSSDEGGAK